MSSYHGSQEQKMTDAEIQQFQTDKQRKLNQANTALDTGCQGMSLGAGFVTLKDCDEILQFHQIQSFSIENLFDLNINLSVAIYPLLPDVHYCQVPIVFALRLSQVPVVLIVSAEVLKLSKGQVLSGFPRCCVHM